MSVTAIGDPGSAWGDFRLLVQEGLYSDQIPEARKAHDITPIVHGFDLYEQPNQAGVRLEFTIEAIDDSKLVHIGTRTRLETRHLDPDTQGPTDTLQRTFLGLILHEERSVRAGARTKTYTSYDHPSALARTDHTFVFENQRADEIFTFIADDMSYEPTFVANTEVPLARVVQRSGQSIWSFLAEVLELTTEKTGKRYIIRSSGTKHSNIELVEIGNTGTTWVLNDSRMEAYQFSEDAQDLRTEVNVTTEAEDDENPTARQVVRATEKYAIESEIVQVFGVLRKIIGPDGADDTAAQNAARAAKELEEASKTAQRLTTDSLLIPGIRRGDTVRVESAMLGSSTTWYADSVRSSYRPNGLTQSLELVFRSKDVSQ